MLRRAGAVVQLRRRSNGCRAAASGRGVQRRRSGPGPATARGWDPARPGIACGADQGAVGGAPGAAVAGASRPSASRCMQEEVPAGRPSRRASELSICSDSSPLHRDGEYLRRRAAACRRLRRHRFQVPSPTSLLRPCRMEGRTFPKHLESWTKQFRANDSCRLPITFSKASSSATKW